MEEKIFYRVANIETQQGLWYDWNGEFTGLIHNKFDFCVNSELPMPFDDSLIGWLSATKSLEQLWGWFTREDIYALQKHGWYLYAFKATLYKDYANHQVIDKETSTPYLKFDISSDLKINNIIHLKSPQRVAE